MMSVVTNPLFPMHTVIMTSSQFSLSNDRGSTLFTLFSEAHSPPKVLTFLFSLKFMLTLLMIRHASTSLLL